MANTNHIKITINGVHYTISTTESREYVQRLAKELDDQVTGVIEKNPTLSFNDVMVLCAMSYVDAYKRSEENADRMRTQISEYLEDAAKARISLDDAKKETAGMKKERDDAKRESGNLKKNLEELKKQKASLEEQLTQTKADLGCSQIREQQLEKTVDGCRIVDHRVEESPRESRDGGSAPLPGQGGKDERGA